MPSRPPPLVLLVEDELDLAATCERLLRRLDCHVVSAGSRRAGLAAMAAAPPPDLVVSDLRLPDGDGIDVVRAARGGVTPIPVIVMTGYGHETARAAALSAGASAYLAKPFTAARFIELVQEVLGVPR